MNRDIYLTGNEVFFDDEEIIVSKTDLKGRLTYCNDVFLKVAGYSEKELLGQPHNVIRHPEMPRCVYKLLWDTLAAGREIFAYVVNRAKNGDHYWTLAHVTPSRDRTNHVVGYHSSRRVPDRGVVDEKIVPLYRSLLAVEQKHGNRKDGMQAAFQAVVGLLEESGVDYDEFVCGLKTA